MKMKKKKMLFTLLNVSQFLLEKTPGPHNKLYGLAIKSLLRLFTEACTKKTLGIKVTPRKH